MRGALCCLYVLEKVLCYCECFSPLLCYRHCGKLEMFKQNKNRLRPVFEKEPSVECMKDNKTQLFLSLDDPSSLCDLGGGHTAPDSMDLVISLGNEM